MKRLLCIGDSLTSGVVAGGGTPYVDVLRERLVPYEDWEIVTAAAGGCSSLDFCTPPHEIDHDRWPGFPPGTVYPAVIAGAFEQLVEPQLPADMAVVFLGGNDAVGFFEAGPVSLEDYERAIESIISRLEYNGVKLILGCTPIPNPGRPENVQERLQDYGVIVGDLFSHHQSVDLFPLMDTEAHFIGNNCHPNEAGHRVIGEAIAEAVRWWWCPWLEGR